MHLIMNMFCQLYFGTSLELVFGWWRVAVIYLIGAIGGSLATSVAHPGTESSGVGASGAAYALFGASFANLFMVSATV